MKVKCSKFQSTIIHPRLSYLTTDDLSWILHVRSKHFRFLQVIYYHRWCQKCPVFQQASGLSENMRCTLQLGLNARSTTVGHHPLAEDPEIPRWRHPQKISYNKLPPRPDRQSLSLTTIPTTGPSTTDHRPSHHSINPSIRNVFPHTSRSQHPQIPTPPNNSGPLPHSLLFNRFRDLW